MEMLLNVMSRCSSFVVELGHLLCDSNAEPWSRIRQEVAFLDALLEMLRSVSTLSN